MDNTLNGIDNNFQSEFGDIVKDIDLLDRRGLSIIHQSVLRLSDLQLENILAASTLELNAVDSKGRTALSYAAVRSDLKALRTLVSFRADVQLSDRRGRSPLHYAATSKDPSCIAFLLQSGASIHSQDKDGQFPLHFTSSVRNCPENIRTLISAGAAVDCRDSDGDTPISVAINMDMAQNVKVLLEHGTSTTYTKDYGSSLFNAAIALNRYKVLRVLLESEIAMDGRSRDGSTLLHTAAWWAAGETMDLLAAADLRSIDVHAEDIRGNSAPVCFRNRLLEKRLRDVFDREQLLAAWDRLWESACRQKPRVEEVDEMGWRDSDDKSVVSDDEGADPLQYTDAVEVQETD